MQHYTEHVCAKLAVYREAMQIGGYSNVVIASGSLNYQFRDDLNQPFRASSYFVEWVPLPHRPDCFVLIDSEKDKPTLYLKVANDFWHSAEERVSESIADTFSVREYESDDTVNQILSRLNNTALIAPESVDILVSEATTRNPENLLNVIDYRRAVKTNYEMHSMRRANLLAVQGHRAAREAMLAEKSEYEIHMDYLTAIGCQDYELPYQSVVAVNENCAVLHHMQLDRNAKRPFLSCLLDAGARVNGYAADITRTYSPAGTSNQFSELLRAVDTMQQDLISRLCAGTDFVSLHRACHRSIATILAQSDIIACSAEQAVEEGLTSAFFPHGLGHLIGVQVHERGGTLASPDGSLRQAPRTDPFLRCTRTIEEGMAVTIEPGIYFIDSLLAPWLQKGGYINQQRLAELSPFGGVRIEDTVIVLEKSNENLTREAFAVK